MNAGSGHQQGVQRQQTVEALLREAGRTVEVQLVRRPRELPAAIQRAIDGARKAGGAVVAAGGDGTINAVVQQVLGSGLPFGALPQGTFNFFGRNQRLSEDIETATRDLLDAEIRDVQVGLVNERVFLVNASVGLYRRVLEDREAFKTRLGRSRLVALWAGLNTVLGTHPRLRLSIRGPDGTTNENLLSMIVGNNRLQLEKLGIEDAEAVEQGHLIGIRLRPQSRMAVLGLALRGVLGYWADGEHRETFRFDELTISRLSARRRLRVAIDGEITLMRSPLRIRVAAEPLRLLMPRPVKEPDSAAANPQ